MNYELGSLYRQRLLSGVGLTEQTIAPTRRKLLLVLTTTAILIQHSLAWGINSGSEAVARGSSHSIQTVMTNGGWSWYQDPRAIIVGNLLIVGGVEGSGEGNAVVGVYDLLKNQQLGRAVVHSDFERDDHNSPVFFLRDDSSLLAVYAKHGSEQRHYYRISDSGNYLSWGEEHTIDHDDPTTYMNLLWLESEQKLYNFFRGIKWNPSVVTSADQGKTWDKARHFIASDLRGRQRPYPRYAGKSTDTVAVSFTDGHPRDFGNSVYYAEFRQGNFHRADGALIKNWREEGPLRPSEAERIYRGSGSDFRHRNLSVPNSGWTSSMAQDAKGRPHIAYLVYLNDNDRRYRIASWDGKRWRDREVAHAGSKLYKKEASYTGLITLDPGDPYHVVLSTDVNPSTGVPLGGLHQVFRARVEPGDDIATIAWQQLTNDPIRHNIRPIIVDGDGHKVLLWLRGRYYGYTDYKLDVMGIELTDEPTPQ